MKSAEDILRLLAKIEGNKRAVTENTEADLYEKDSDKLLSVRDDEWATKVQAEKAQAAKKELENLSLRQDISERKAYALKTFWFLCWFTGTAFFILIFSGLSVLKLSESVLIALITSSFASVVSIFIWVMRYLFRRKI